MRKFSRNRPPAPHHSLLKAIQAHFGLTQERIADVLGVSRATLTQYGTVSVEGTLRSLPTDALLRLVALQQLLPAPHGPAPTPPIPPTAPLPASDRETLDLRRRELQLQQYQVEQKLARCEVHLAQGRLRQQALPALRTVLDPADTLTESWLALFEREAHRMQEEESTAQLLKLRLRVLAFEAAEIEQLLGE